MDSTTTGAFVVLGLIVVGTVWWYVRDELRQRRRARAKAWARQQMSPEATPDAPRPPRPVDRETGPLDPWPTADLDGMPSLVRPFLRMKDSTDVFPRVQDAPEAPDS